MKPTVSRSFCSWRRKKAGASASAPLAEKLDPKRSRGTGPALDGKDRRRKPVTCVSTFRGNNLHAISAVTLVYRVSKKLTYRNDLQGACHGLRFGDTLVLKVTGDQYCPGRHRPFLSTCRRAH